MPLLRETDGPLRVSGVTPPCAPLEEADDEGLASVLAPERVFSGSPPESDETDPPPRGLCVVLMDRGWRLTDIAKSPKANEMSTPLSEPDGSVWES